MNVIVAGYSSCFRPSLEEIEYRTCDFSITRLLAYFTGETLWVSYDSLVVSSARVDCYDLAIRIADKTHKEAMASFLWIMQTHRCIPITPSLKDEIVRCIKEMPPHLCYTILLSEE